MKHFYFIVTFVFLFSCCKNGQTIKDNDNNQIPADFYFEIHFGRPKSNLNTDNFNTKNSLFQRGYSNGDTSIRINLTAQETQKIYLSFFTNDFLKLPEEVDQDTFLNKGIDMTDISLFSNGQLKKVRCFNYEILPQTNELDRFENVKKTILGIITSKQNYKSLKPSDLIGI